MTQTATTQSIQPDFQFLLWGLDSLYVAYHYDIRTGDIDLDELQYLKDQLRDDPVKEVERVELGRHEVFLQPYGRYPYPWLFTTPDFEIQLAEKMQPSLFVKFSSRGLWTRGLEALCKDIDDIAAGLKLTRTKPEVISRADWAFDYHLPSLDFDIEHFVSRARKDNTWRNAGHIETFMLGAGDVVYRMYNKSAETVQASGKVWFYEMWGRQDDVWRNEFQVRRARLKSAGINSLDDLKTLQGDLLHELVTNHTTLRQPNGDNNRSRWALHPLWNDLQGRILELPRMGLVKAFDPVKELHWRRHDCLKSIYGYCKALGAMQMLMNSGSDAPTLEQVLVSMEKGLDAHHHPHAFRLDI